MTQSSRRWLAGLLGLCSLGMATGAAATDLPAVVDWSQRVELGTLVSGVVHEVHVRPGQAVSRGDALVSLDDRGFRSRVDRRLAEHAHAQAMLAEAQREDERALELYDRTVLSDFERNQALVALKAARAQAQAARSALVHARLALERSVVRAPFDGVVLAVNVAPGQSVVSELQSQPQVVLADNRVYWARARVDAAQASGLEAGQRLRATLRGHALQATVDHVGLEPVARSEHGPEYALVAGIRADPQRPLRAGESLILHLE